MMPGVSPVISNILTTLLTALTSSGFLAIILYKIQRHDRKLDEEKSKESAESKMLLGLGHDRLVALTDKYVKRGGITLKEKRNLEYLYKPYRDMGGNGDCQIGYEACQLLQIMSEEEAGDKDAEIKRQEYKIV